MNSLDCDPGDRTCQATQSLLLNLTAEIHRLEKEVHEMKEDFTGNDNAFFMCSMALIIFLMQCGFAFLEAGAVRSKNTTNILIKNLLDSCIAVIGYWAIGWALAYGKASNGTVGLFVGYSEFFLAGTENYPKFFFQYVFAATSATIVSGAVAERCDFTAYITYCSVISSIIYPILTHWGWSDQGWMHKGIVSDSISTTYTDFAGSGVVHLCGGTISFVAAYMMGPRIGRFPRNSDEEVHEIQGHSVPFAALGGFILMFGFLAFNGGSTADIVKPGEGNIVALAMINTILCGAFSALTYLTIHYITKGKWTLLLTINACLTGMVASCAGCNLMRTWACAFTGIGAALCYLALGKLMIRLKIDDPLDAFAVHAGGGFWGLFSVAFIAKQGVVYGIHDSIHTGDQIHVQRAFAQLGWQMICALAIIIWSVATMIPVFTLLKKLNRFRVSEEIEIKGLDIYKHGEAAYPLRAYGHGWDEIESIKDVQHRKRTLSEHVEVSLEELAAAYEGRLLEVEGRERQDSVYYNPANFEHLEHHHKANGKSHFRKSRHPSTSHKKISFRKEKTAVEKNGSAQVYPSITVENAEDVWADQKL